jgi:hypothetical protein
MPGGGQWVRFAPARRLAEGGNRIFCPANAVFPGFGLGWNGFDLDESHLVRRSSAAARAGWV